MLDQTTYQLAKKGKSWKINLVKDLDFALENCKSKIELIDFLNKKDYSVKYTDTNIMITKNGEKKGIRVDTLAKQFGGKYSKESIEKTIGYYSPQEKKIQNVFSPVAPLEKKKRKVQQKTFSSEWERYEAWAFKKENNIPDIKFPNSSKSYSLNPQNFTLKVVLFFALMNSRTCLHKLKSSQKCL